MSQLDQLLSQLWDDFRTLNPQADEIHRLLEERGETVVNDHVAFRTFDDPRIGIEALARPFRDAGYEPRGEYEFPNKHLFARHFELPGSESPRIFISELKRAELSPESRTIVDRLIAQVPEIESIGRPLCLAGRPWTISYADYERLRGESEYAGWMAAFGFHANHFTVLVNRLTTIGSVDELNDFLKRKGFALNAQGGEVKGSPEVLLEQSSTLAAEIDVEFEDGPHRIPSCYYEFARRYPQADGTLFGGFVAQSADKIFHSTDRRDKD